MKAARVLSTITILIAFLSSNAQAQTRADAASEAYRDFSYRTEHQWRPRWDSTTGTLASLLGAKIYKYKGEPVNIARSFLSDERLMFGIENPTIELSVAEIRQSKGGTRVLFAQHHKDIAVIGGGFLVAIDGRGGIYYVSGTHWPEISIDTHPTLAASQASTSAARALNDSAVTIRAPELAILPVVEEGGVGYRLVYSTAVRELDNDRVWDVLVDAISGEMVRVVSAIDDIVGNIVDESGDVYLSHPDDASITTVTLHRLNSASPLALDGDNVVVHDDRGSSYDAVQYSGPFAYSASDFRFDQVMAYYHADEFEEWLVGLGLGSSALSKVTIYTHDDTYYASAFPSTNTLRFAQSATGLKNPTHEAAIIAHEYMHLVSELYSSLTANDEEDAMDESYSDYFGLAYQSQNSSTTTIIEYADILGVGNYSRRNAVNSWHYDDFDTIDADSSGTTSQHDQSRIFTGGLWDFRTDAADTEVADELVLESLNNLDSNSSFEEGREALIAAAIALSYPSYEQQIANAFYDHGIGDPYSAPPSNLVITNATQTGQSPSLSWDASSASGATYKIYRCKSYYQSCASTESQIATTSSTSYTDWVVTITSQGGADDRFSYRVTADLNGDYIGSTSYAAVWGESFQKRGDLRDEKEGLPVEYALNKSHPNPFRERTTIQYDLPEDSHVSIEVFNTEGKRIAQLVDSWKSAGRHDVDWRASEIGTGVYYVVMQAGQHRSAQSVVHVR